MCDELVTVYVDEKSYSCEMTLWHDGPKRYDSTDNQTTFLWGDAKDESEIWIMIEHSPEANTFKLKELILDENTIVSLITLDYNNPNIKKYGEWFVGKNTIVPSEESFSQYGLLLPRI